MEGDSKGTDCPAICHDDCARCQPIEEPLPEWAAKRSDGTYMEVGAQLCTRDGRKIGNAVVIDVQEPYAEIVTDVGTIITFTREELQEFFHEPEWKMLPQNSPGVKAYKEKKNDPTSPE